MIIKLLYGTPWQTTSIFMLESPINSMIRQKDMTPKDELPRSVGAQYTTGEDWRNTPERMKRWSQSKKNAQLWM